MTDTADTLARLTDFVRGLLPPEQAALLTPESPLGEWGVLDSLGLAKLIGFIRGELGVAIPARELTGRRLGCLDDLAALVLTHA